MDVVGVGIATIDVIHEVDAYPADSITVGTEKQVVCSQLGGHCRWMGMTTDPEKDSDASFIFADLARFNVNCKDVTIVSAGSMPVSYILTSNATGSRTIIHSRDLPELSAESFQSILLHRERLVNDQESVVPSFWFHFEGRNLENVMHMMKFVRLHYGRNVVLSLEIEALRHEWGLVKKLAALVDYVFLSKDYIRECLDFQNATHFLRSIQEEKQTGQKESDHWHDSVTAIVCPWGSEGVYYIHQADSSVIHHIPTTKLPEHSVVESIGAGDSFIGAAIAGLSQHVPIDHVLTAACEVATAKCLQHGFAFPVEQLQKWKQAFAQHAHS